MSSTKFKNRRFNKNTVYSVILLFFFIFSIFSSIKTFADVKTFTVENITVIDKSDGVETKIIEYSNYINSEAIFHNVGDSVTYKATIKNNEKNDITIESVNDDNNNDFLVYEYDKNINKVLKSGESFDFVYRIIYNNEVETINNREQNYNVTFSFLYQDSNGNENTDTVVVNPKTGDIITRNFLLFSLSSIGLVLCIIRKMLVKNKKLNKSLLLLLLSFLFIPIAVNAYSSSFSLVIKNELKLYDKLLVTYNINNKEITKIIKYGENIELEEPSKDGYVFKGWNLEDGQPLDKNTIITEDTILVAVFEKIESNITINVTNENIDTAYKKVSIDVNLNNIESDKVSTMYSLDNGKTWTTYDKEFYIEENLTIKAKTMVIESGLLIGEVEKEINSIVALTSNIMNTEEVYEIQVNLGSYNHQVDDITLIKYASIEKYEQVKDDLTEDNIVSTIDSETPTYMWIEETEEEIILYYYSDAKTIFLNEMSDGFYSYFEYLKEIDFSKINTSKVTTMSGLFEDDHLLTSLDLSTFDTSEVKDMSYMFYDCTSLEYVDLSSFNTSKVKKMSNMFDYVSSITTIDISNFDLTNVTANEYMFANMSNLKTIYSGMNFSTASTNVFSNSNKLVGGKGTTYKATKTSSKYAVIDNPENGEPGYFTEKNLIPVYKIIFDGNGIDITNNIKYIKAGDKIKIITNIPTREEYVFDGWYTDAVEGVKVDKNYIPESDITLYAHWNEKEKYTITFDYGDGRTETRYVIVDLSLGDLDSPTREKYIFKGWYTDASGGTKVDKNYVPEQSMTIYARWQEIFNIILDGNGIELDNNTINVLEGNKIGTLPNLERLEYFFDGWYTDASGGTKVDNNYIPESDITLYALWTLKDIYTITYDYGDGRSETVSIYEKSSLETLPTPTIEDKVLDGWYKESTFENKITSSLIPTSDATYYAKWSSMIDESNDSNMTLSSTTCSNNENIIIEDGIVCKRALNLHQEVCNSVQGCRVFDQFALDETITYGSCGTRGNLTAGDAFTCDVNGDGKFNEETERFYYISDYYNTNTNELESDTAVLLYYNNVSSGKASNNTNIHYSSSDDIEALGYSCNSEYGCNWFGPITAIKELPTTLQWSNVRLKNNNRQILSMNSTGYSSTYIPGGDMLPKDFSYNGYAARMLTINEIIKGLNLEPNVDFMNFYYLKDYYFLLENTRFAQENSPSPGWKFENPGINSTVASWVMIYFGDVINMRLNINTSYGVRPAIEVPKTSIDY